MGGAQRREWLLMVFGCAAGAVFACGCGGTTRGNSSLTSGGGRDGGHSGGSIFSSSGGRSSVDSGAESGGRGGTRMDASSGNGGSYCDLGITPHCPSEGMAACANYVTGFAGDESCLVPPVNGFQIHVGPTSYDDPADVARFLLAPGAEGISCYDLKSPNGEVAYTNHSYVRMRPGSAGLSVLALPGEVPDSVALAPCAPGGSGRLLLFASGRDTDAALFGGAPEDSGIADEMPAHQQLSVVPHFYNTTDSPLLEELWINFTTIPASTVTGVASALSWFGGQSAVVPPRSRQLIRVANCTPPGDVRLLALVGHTTSSTVRVAAYRQAPGTGPAQPLFEDYAWQAPTPFRFNSVISNPVPDPATKTPGAFSGDVPVAAGDTFSWECEVDNTTDSSLTFDARLFTGHSCAVLGKFVGVSQGAPWTCTGP